MKRLLIIFLSVLMAFSCVACGDESDTSSSAPKDIDVIAEANEIISKYSLSGGTFYTPDGEDILDEDLILSYFGDATSVPDFTSVETYALYIDETKPVSPCEFGIFKIKDGVDANAFKAFLVARINMKLQNAAAYPDMDTSALTSAKFAVKGNYVWYCAVKDANEDINSTLEGKL